MSSLWDSFGQKFYNGTLPFAEVAELVEFLRGFDKVNNNMVGSFMERELSFFTKYTWRGYDQFLTDMQTRGMSKQTLEHFLGGLHTFDHANNEILMYSFSRDKKYWHKHRAYQSGVYGIFQNGAWTA